MVDLGLLNAAAALALVALPLTELSLTCLAVPTRYELLAGSVLVALYAMVGAAVLAVVIP